MIGIVDYGMGNLRSVQKACEHAGVAAELTSDPQEISGFAGLILPGVGAFARAMVNLERTGLRSALLTHVGAGRPFLGICLGLQLLFEQSEESFDGQPALGLGVVPGRVVRFSGTNKVPQIGWNQIHKQKENVLLQSVRDGTYVYFVHSYFVSPLDPSWILTTTDYGVDFPSSIARDGVWGIQFHPEKSSAIGLRILRNFGDTVRKGAVECVGETSNTMFGRERRASRQGDEVC